MKCLRVENFYKKAISLSLSLSFFLRLLEALCINVSIGSLQIQIHSNQIGGKHINARYPFNFFLCCVVFLGIVYVFVLCLVCSMLLVYLDCPVSFL